MKAGSDYVWRLRGVYPFCGCIGGGSEAENARIFSTFATYGGVDRNLWIGLNDAAVQGTFVWTSGEPVTFTKSAPGEPNSDPPYDADYVHLWKPNTVLFPWTRVPSYWNDIGNSGYANGLYEADLVLGYGVVEVVPQPVPTPTALPGGYALADLGPKIDQYLQLRHRHSNSLEVSLDRQAEGASASTTARADQPTSRETLP